MKEKIIWVENVKVIACALVVLGHFFQSMVDADLIKSNSLYLWFNQTIYYFHVPLFFICSGFIYQKYTTVINFKTWKNNCVKKIINLGIPYFVFSIITLCLKNYFSGYVNGDKDNFLKTLFLQPNSQYWYLYILLFLFVLIPTITKKKSAYIIITLLIVTKLTIPTIDDYIPLPYFLSGVLTNGIWFVLGMVIEIIKPDKIFSKNLSRMFPVFIVLSVYVYYNKVYFIGLNLILGLIACFSIISYMYKTNKNLKAMEFLSRYTLPIFLMHTIFSAGVRTILVRIGIHDVGIHFAFGIFASFCLPILTAKLIENVKYLNVFLYPSKYIKIPNNKKSKILINNL